MPTYDENGALLVNVGGGGVLLDHQHSAAGDGGPLAVGVTDTDLTAGSVMFAGVGGLLQEDNANLFWDDGNNRLGVGIAPATNFHVYDTASFVARVEANAAAAFAGFQVQADDAAKTINLQMFGGAFAGNQFGVPRADAGTIFADGCLLTLGTKSAYDFVLGTTNLERMRITAAGDVGINDSAPSRRLQVVDDSASTNVVIPIARLEGKVSGGGAAGHGPGLEFHGESSTTEDQSMGEIAATWETATHASRRAQLRFFADLQGTLHPVGVIVAPTTAPGAVPAVNAWGAGAVDFGTYRTVATEVASGISATIGGGTKNTASGQEATVSGGRFCQATGDWSTVTGGGDAGLVTPNLASGDYATVCGGESNTVSGDHSWGGGQLASVTHASCFVWSSAAATASWAANTFTARCHGGARFYSAAGVGTGVQLAAGGNAWAAISARAAKANFRPVTNILDKVARLPIYNYNLKAQPDMVRHIGAVAEEFNKIFGFTEAKGYINSMDVSGVALAAIKALIERIENLEEKLQ